MKDGLTQLQKFVEDNGLDFKDSGSGLNSVCIILAGYADHIGAFLTEVKDVFSDISKYPNQVELHKEIENTYKTASRLNYGKWWTSEDAKKMYTF